MFYNTLLLCVIAEKRQMKKFYKNVDDPLNRLYRFINSHSTLTYISSWGKIKPLISLPIALMPRMQSSIDISISIIKQIKR